MNCIIWKEKYGNRGKSWKNSEEMAAHRHGHIRGHVHVNGLAVDAEIHALQLRKMENLIEKNIDEYLKKDMSGCV